MSAEISVILPVYNSGNLLEGALESLYSQSFSDWEAILVDDCSDDSETITLIASIQDLRIEIIRHKTNKGLSAARNTGMQRSKAPIIMSLDYDDRLAPDALGKIVAAFNTNPTIDVFYPDIVRVTNQERKIVNNPDYDFEKILQKNYIQSQSPMRRWVFEKVGGYCEEAIFRKGMEDIDFWLSALEVGAKFKRLPFPLYEYRDRPGSQSHNQQLDAYLLRRHIVTRHKKMLHGKLRKAYLFDGAVRSYRTSVGTRNKRLALRYFLSISRQGMWPPSYWWKAVWNLCDPFIKSIMQIKGMKENP